MARPSKTLAVGDKAPPFTLSTPDKSPWSLAENLPVALFFLRGTF